MDYARIPIRTTATTLAKPAHQILARRGVPIQPSDREIVAYVSDNRWVANCAHCIGGVALTPGQGATCTSCGADYPAEAVSWPEDREEIEAALLPRRPEHRHAMPGQNAEELRRENRLMMGS